jgi:hypothetical protein
MNHKTWIIVLVAALGAGCGAGSDKSNNTQGEDGTGADNDDVSASTVDDATPGDKDDAAEPAAPTQPPGEDEEEQEAVVDAAASDAGQSAGSDAASPVKDASVAEAAAVDPCSACPPEAPICDSDTKACRYSVAGVWEGKLPSGAQIRLMASETEVVEVTTNVTLRYVGNSCPSAVTKGTKAAPIHGVPPSASVYLFAANAANGWDMQVQFDSAHSAKASWPAVANGGLICTSPTIVSIGTSSTVVPAQSFVLSRN